MFTWGVNARRRSTIEPSGDAPDSSAGIWCGLRQAYLDVTHELDSALRTAHRLPLGEYELLRALSHPGCTQRMAGLAGAVGLSPSGLTRAIERLEVRGLVRRVPCPADGRGAMAELEPAGESVLQEASVTHDAVLRQVLLDRLSAEETAHLLEIWAHISGSTRHCSRDGQPSDAHHPGEGGVAAAARSIGGKGSSD